MSGSTRHIAADQSQPIRVAVAVIRDPYGNILLTQRPPGKHLAGLWEFPGGKQHDQETSSEALWREITEEVGLKIELHRPLIQVPYTYPEKRVLLDVHLVERWQGKPYGREGQQIAWVKSEELDKYELLPANRSIVTSLRLPATYAISPAQEPLTNLLTALKQNNARPALLQWRRPDLSLDAYAAEAEAVQKLCHRLGIDLLVKEISLAKKLGCGVHLTSRALLGLKKRPLPSGHWVAASCHSFEQLRLAEVVDLDFVTLSPILEGYTGLDSLGWEGFSRLAVACRLPIYALGGMSSGQIQQAWSSGAQGVAGIRAFWSKVCTG